MNEKLLKTLGVVILLAFAACSESVKPEEEISDEKELSSGSSQKEKVTESSSSRNKDSAYSSSKSNKSSSSETKRSSSSEINRSSSSKENQSPSGIASSSSMTADNWDSTFVDPRDGRVYRTVLVDDQLWFGQNLNYEVPNSWCYNDYAPNCDKYGRLYTPASASKACPDGWHLPNQEEFYDAVYHVIKKLGGDRRQLDLLISPDLASTFGWTDGIPSGDDYGLSFLPAGKRTHYVSYDGIGKGAYFVVAGTSIGESALFAYYKYMGYLEYKNVTFVGGSWDDAHSVRCVYNDKIYNPNDMHVGPRIVEKWSEPPELKPYEGLLGEFEDPRDGRVYKTVDIDGQLWMAQNMNYATENSFCYERDESNCEYLGRLYEVSDIDSVCPAGWKIPSSADMQKLLYSAAKVSGGEIKLGYVLKADSTWEEKQKGIDALGFNLLPAGEKSRKNNGEDAYAGLGKWAFLYALDSTGKAFAVEFGSNNFENDVLYNEKYYEISGVGHSIRCVNAASASD